MATVDRGNASTVFEKRVSAHWLLRKRAHGSIHHPVGRGVYFDTHELVNVRTGETLARDDWEWADVDGGRIVWAARGCLFAGRLEAQGLRSTKLLFDFAPLEPEKLAAPY